jgi:DNA-binding transcriptional LysR family regulator
MTELGHVVRPQLKAILAQSDQIRTTARSFLQLKDAPLKLGVMCTIGPMRFVGFLASFGRNHPGIELSLTESTPAILTDGLIAGDLDVALVAEPSEPKESLELRPIYKEHFMVACSPGHRFERMESSVKKLD